VDYVWVSQPPDNEVRLRVRVNRRGGEIERRIRAFKTAELRPLDDCLRSFMGHWRGTATNKIVTQDSFTEGESHRGVISEDHLDVDRDITAKLVEPIAGNILETYRISRF
jgi:hypothetical protein